MPALWTPVASVSVSQLITAAWLNTYIRDNIMFLLASAGLVPVGLVVASGDLPANAPPDGWLLADGGGGTIDTRNSMFVGAGSTYAVGAAGGASVFTPAGHSNHATGQAATHVAHTVTQPDHGGSWAMNSQNGIFDLVGVRDPYHVGASLSGAHTHSGAGVDPHGSHGSVSLLPPYSARPFLQRTTSALASTTPRTWTTGETPTAAMMNADFRDNPKYLRSRTLPQKTILHWFSSLATIPAPFSSCNGVSTVDMRDRVLLGSGSAYNPGDSGGAPFAAYTDHPAHVATQSLPHGSHSTSNPGTHTTISTDHPVQGAQTFLATGGHSGFNADAHSLHTGFGVDAHSDHAGFNVLPPFRALVAMQLLSTPYTTARTFTTGEVVTASVFNTFGRDNLLSLFAGLFPIGGIAKWSGSIASIPANYQLCNGSGGTVDMRDRFAIGAEQVASGTDGVTNSSNRQLTAASGTWTSAMVGRLILIGSSFRTIASVSNPTTLIYAGPSLATAAGVTWSIGLAPGATGGAVSITPTAHAAHVVSQGVGHTAHVLTQPLAHPTIVTNYSNIGVNPQDPNHNLAASGHNAHTGMTVDAHSAHASVATLPPYKAYAYVQRVS